MSWWSGGRRGENFPSKSEGAPLPEDERTRLEAVFQQDLRDVRVHRDEAAARYAAEAGTEAVTVGRNIYFAAGAYSSELLAHKVSHVIQRGTAATSKRTR